MAYPQLSKRATASMLALAAFDDCTVVTADACFRCSGAMLASVSDVFKVMLTPTLAQAAQLDQPQLLGGEDDDRTDSNESDCMLEVQEPLQILAPIFEMAYDAEFTVHEDNIEAVIYCHDHYECPNLDAACQVYLNDLVDCMQASTAVAVTNFVAKYGTQRAANYCLEWMATHMDDLLRTEDGLDALTGDLARKLLVAGRTLWNTPAGSADRYS